MTRNSKNIEKTCAHQQPSKHILGNHHYSMCLNYLTCEIKHTKQAYQTSLTLMLVQPSKNGTAVMSLKLPQAVVVLLAQTPLSLAPPIGHAPADA